MVHLLLEQRAHLIGDGADLAADTVIDVIERLLQVLIVLPDGTQLPEQIQQQRAREHAAEDGWPAAALRLRRLIAPRQLLHHPQLRLGQLTFIVRGSARTRPPGRSVSSRRSQPTGDGELAAQRHQLFDLRQRRVRLPFIDRLPRDAQLRASCSCERPSCLPPLRDSLSDGHMPGSFLSCWPHDTTAGPQTPPTGGWKSVNRRFTSRFPGEGACAAARGRSTSGRKRRPWGT